MRAVERLVVVTGGPGGGKSSLIEALGRAGHATCEEAGRRVIREELASSGAALPWADRSRFAERMLAFDLAAHALAVQRDGPTFFDRGAPDVLGYLGLCGIEAPPALERAARSVSYATRVFLAPFWPEIFVNDAERKQTPDEARRTAETMRETYAALGHEVVELPKASVDERVAFVLAACGLMDAGTSR